MTNKQGKTLGKINPSVCEVTPTTFPLKFGLDILWLPNSLVDIQYAQV
jgi:hypothetical protein